MPNIASYHQTNLLTATKAMLGLIRLAWTKAMQDEDLRKEENRMRLKGGIGKIGLSKSIW